MAELFTIRGVFTATGRLVEHTLAAGSAAEAKARAEASGLQYVVVEPVDRPCASADPGAPRAALLFAAESPRAGA